MSTIRALRWRPFKLPMSVAANAAHGATSWREGVFIELTDSDGRTALGEASPLPSYAGGTADECVEAMPEIVTQVLGRKLAEAWESDLLLPTTLSSGSATALRCGVESAIAGLQSAKSGRPLFHWLGGEGASATVQVNGLVDDPTPEGAASEATLLVAQGFETLKLKLGFGEAVDCERMRAVASAAGPGITLRGDANGAWNEVEAALMLRHCEAAGFTFVEQPVAPALGPEALARLRREVPGVQLAADEGCRTVAQFEALLAASAIDAVVVKPMVTGLRESLRIIAAAEEAGVPVIVTTTFDSGIGHALAMHLAALLSEPRPACGLATYSRLASDFVTGVPPVVAGAITVSEAPGLGVTLDEPALEALATGPWQECLA